MKGIYKITNNINNKCYIGSSVNIKRRIITHKYFLKKGTHHCEHLQRAWLKYGCENFKFEIIEIVDDVLELEEIEQKYIDNVNREMLYNGCLKAGNKSGFKHSDDTKKKIGLGNKGKKQSEETKKKLSEINKGKKLSDETKNKISNKLIGVSKKFSDEILSKYTERLKPYMNGQKKGFKHSDISKKRMSDAKINNKLSDEHKQKISESLKKQIVQYDKEMNFIKSWSSVKEASVELGIRSNYISSVLTGAKKSTNGFIFKYK